MAGSFLLFYEVGADASTSVGGTDWLSASAGAHLGIDGAYAGLDVNAALASITSVTGYVDYASGENERTRVSGSAYINTLLLLSLVPIGKL